MDVEVASEKKHHFKLKIRNLDNVPVLATGTWDIIALIHDPDIDRFVKALEKNQTIVIKLIALANSAYFSPLQPIVDVKTAVIRLGLPKTKSLVISAIMGGTFNSKKCPSFEAQRHWLQAALVSDLLLRVCKQKKIEPQQVAALSTVSLVHNLGLVILADLFSEEMNTIFSNIRIGEPGLNRAIQETFEINQYQVFAWVLKKWDVPDLFIEQIGNLANRKYYGDQFIETVLLRDSIKLANAMLSLTDEDDPSKALPDDLFVYRDAFLASTHDLEKIIDLAKCLTLQSN